MVSDLALQRLLKPGRDLPDPRVAVRSHQFPHVHPCMHDAAQDSSTSSPGHSLLQLHRALWKSTQMSRLVNIAHVSSDWGMHL